MYIVTLSAVVTVTVAKAYRKILDPAEFGILGGVLLGATLVLFRYRTVTAGFAAIVPGAVVGYAAYRLSQLELWGPTEAYFYAFAIGTIALALVPIIAIALPKPRKSKDWRL
ncbi:MAG: hypothetical protein Aurels2KO_45140 [Aureliella sp.]